ncbi:MAG: carboxypeptidase-like regulatory domain-containing protein [Actinomycetota bacterium]
MSLTPPFPARVLGLTVCVVVLTGVSAPAWGQPEAYSGAEIRGWVVDAETKQPIEGVYVVAQSLLDTGLRQYTPLHMTETITDAKGEYHIPAWGPKPRPTFSRLEDSDPVLTFFRPGYRMFTRSNPVDRNDSAVRASRWDGKTISLQPFRGTPDDWADQLWRVQSRLQWGGLASWFSRRLNDYWKHYPKTVLAIVEERRLLPDSVRHRVMDLDEWELAEEQLRAAAQQKGRTP